MAKHYNENRRRLLLGITGLMAAWPLRAAQRLLQPTPAQTAGPFYPVELPLDDDSDLTHVQGRHGQATGRITELSGRILDLNGRPLRSMRIEIWQCDANGRYRHPMDNSNRTLDAYFQGHGHTVTAKDGRYRFRTIHPVPYPGRTPHIHIAVFPSGERPFVTQLYVRGEPRNVRDGIFNSVPVERRELLMANFAPAQHSDTELAAKFDIILGGIDGTPADDVLSMAGFVPL